MNTRMLLLAALLAHAAVLRAGEDFRTWTSTAGTRIEARLLSENGKSVILERRGGARAEINVSLLSPADIEYLSRLRANTPVAAASDGPAFKGLRLGMTRQQVAQLVESSHWNYDEMQRNDPAGTRVYLVPSPAGGPSFGSVAGGTGTAWLKAWIDYKGDSVQKLILQGPRRPDTQNAALLSEWVIPVAAELTREWGAPSSAPADEDRAKLMVLMASGLNRVSFWQYSEWRIGKTGVIRVCVSRDRFDNTCAGEVQFLLLAHASTK